jgi:transglutaminase-like putative cysteine protease
MGFDPTNNLIAVENHIKVAHGKDYSDCPPIKGIIYTTGANETTYTVEVSSQQQQQQQQQ